MKRTTIAYIPSSHLDLYWLGTPKTCLERGSHIIQQYLDRCLSTPDETFLLETVVFAEDFLRRQLDYRQKLVDLVNSGRVEVGAAYVDRMETTLPGESLIRNVLLGKRWCLEVLGIDNPTITHPDLPSLTPQISQLYNQLGVKYYVTSRKFNRHGGVWRYYSPDGSHLLMLNWPRHYVFVLQGADDVAPEVFKHLWTLPLDMEESLKGFPLGTVAVSGSAGDLTDRETFRERYGQYLDEFVTHYRQKYPQYDFTYTIPSKVMFAYKDHPGLPERRGEAPTVWGLAGGEDHRFYTRLYQLESQLLAAEMMVVAANHLHLAWRPPAAAQWQGIFHEGAFFGRKDPIAPGAELQELWRMHIFTQDHNSAGQEGVLSSFQKQALQERGLDYSRQIINFTLEQFASQLPGANKALVVFNPHAQVWRGILPVRMSQADWEAGWRPVDEVGKSIPSQVVSREESQVEVLFSMPELPPVGYQAFHLLKDSSHVQNEITEKRDTSPAQNENPVQLVQIWQDDGLLNLESRYLNVTVDLRNGRLARFYDRQRGQEWGGAQVGHLYSIEEAGNDVSLRISPAAAVTDATFIGAEVLDSGAICTRLRVHLQIFNGEAEQVYTLWHDEPRLDLELKLYWWGKRRQQVRLGLSPAIERANITHGCPFYGVGWNETLEGGGPWNSDEVSPEVQMSYREVVGWLHMAGSNGGLAVCSHHPWFHHAPEGLEAVLMRTDPSCGDERLFLEQPGEHSFTFSFYTCSRDWKADHIIQLAECRLKPPLYRIAQAGGSRTLPNRMSLLQIEGDHFALSSLYPGVTPGSVIVRLFETAGQSGKVRVSGPIASCQASGVDFLEGNEQPLLGQPGAWSLDMPAWGVRSIIFKDNNSV